MQERYEIVRDKVVGVAEPSFEPFLGAATRKCANKSDRGENQLYIELHQLIRSRTSLQLFIA